jgi:5-methylcytosine-specific restriction enzyme A
MTQWQHLYNKRRWRRRSKLQLTMFPLCTICERKGIIVAATEADHIEPHKGYLRAFFTGPLQSLCSDCHRRKGVEERRNYDNEIGLDGFPTDPRHPFFAHK